MRHHHPRRPAQRQRGAVLFLVALCVVPLLIIAAIVIDLGQLRATRRSSQSSSDLAALAAGYYLSGHATAGATPDPRGACTAAVNSLRANIGDLPAAMALDCTLFPTTVINCNAISIPPVLATGASPYAISIQWPVPPSAISNGQFVGGAGANDGTSQCERMKVTVRRTNVAIFSGMLGITSSQAGASSVVRGSSSVTGNGVAALLMLERVGCSVLQTSGGGSQGAGVVVEAAGPSNPGVVQADSAGVLGATVTATGPVTCTTNENASGYVIYGTALPAAGGGGPSIIAANSSDGSQGILGIRALAVGGRGGAVSGTGISPGATAGSVMSRTPADTKYNAPTPTGNAQITTLHSTAYARTTSSAPAGYRVLSGGNCTNLKTATTPVTEQYVYVNCPDFQPDTAIFPNAIDVIMTGKLSIANNKLLSLPNVQRIDVRGCTSGCSGGGNYAISVAGELRVNTGGAGTTTPACSTRAGPGAGGTTTNWARLATFGGPFAVTGTVRLCQTFVYAGENRSTYLRQAQTAILTAPENYPAIAGCTAALPCPSDAGGPAAVAMSGGSATADWSAPNQLASQPTIAELATYPFEDLAVWTESSDPSTVKGQGTNRTEGVFFTPNSSMTFSGQGTQSVPLNAQFISRTLNVSGQGTLSLKPNPADAITTPIPGGIALIR